MKTDLVLFLVGLFMFSLAIVAIGVQADKQRMEQRNSNLFNPFIEESSG
jgi:hypothetical protein